MSSDTIPSSKNPLIVATLDSRRFLCLVEPTGDTSAERRWVFIGENRLIHIGPIYTEGDEAPHRARALVNAWWHAASGPPLR